MTSPIDVKSLEIKPLSSSKKERKDPDFFEKKSRKTILSSEIEEETLTALKTALNKQKNDVQLMAVQFEQTALPKQRIEADVAKIGKIEPSSQVSQLYSKIADTLIHMDQHGIKETIFTLGDAFQTSIFRGATLTLTEFSTAPKLFNIQFTASPEAIAFFASHSADLLHTLNQGTFKWSVYRIDTSLQQTKKYRHIEESAKREEEEA